MSQIWKNKILGKKIKIKHCVNEENNILTVFIKLFSNLIQFLFNSFLES